ncbi:hypothetical protein MHYP_G00121160 [Metynnis hypsauchen]
MQPLSPSDDITVRVSASLLHHCMLIRRCEARKISPGIAKLEDTIVRTTPVPNPGSCGKRSSEIPKVGSRKGKCPIPPSLSTAATLQDYPHIKQSAFHSWLCLMQHTDDRAQAKEASISTS